MGIHQQHKSFFLINILVHLCDISNLNYQQVKPRNFQSGMLMNGKLSRPETRIFNAVYRILCSACIPYCKGVIQEFVTKSSTRMGAVESYLKYIFNMWNVNMYSVLSSIKSFYLLSIRCHHTKKIPEHGLEFFRHFQFAMYYVRSLNKRHRP